MRFNSFTYAIIDELDMVYLEDHLGQVVQQVLAVASGQQQPVAPRRVQLGD